MRVLLAMLLILLPATVRAQPLTVFAAASLTDAMKDVAKLWESGGRAPVRFNFGSSSTLARQLEQGAPGNLFASADTQWMDYAQQRDLILPDTRRNLLGNKLVLVMAKSAAHPVTIVPGFDLGAILGAGGRLAVGDPSNVPAGIYAQQALSRLGVWQAIQSRLAPAENVRSALLLVERGEAPAGIVYETDVAVSPALAVVGVFPESSHDPILYPFAITRSGQTPEARAFLAFLTTPASEAAFRQRGFSVAPR